MSKAGIHQTFERDAQALDALQAESQAALAAALTQLRNRDTLPATLALFTLDEKGGSIPRAVMDMQRLFDEQGAAGKERGSEIINRWSLIPVNTAADEFADFGLYVAEAWMFPQAPVDASKPAAERIEVVLMQALYRDGSAVTIYAIERDASGKVQHLNQIGDASRSVSGRMVAGPQNEEAGRRH